MPTTPSFPVNSPSRAMPRSRAQRPAAPRPPAEARSTEPRPGLAPQVVGGQVWWVAQRPARLHAGPDDRRGGMTVEKTLVALAAAICAVLALVFGVDLLTGWPFGRCSLSMDVTYLIGAVVLAYLTWHVQRELR